MTDETLKSYAFRREREAGWRDLEDILQKAEGRGATRLTAKQLLQLPGLYRAALSSLSVARSISLDANAVSYLESLAARAYLQIYGVRTGFWDGLGGFFRGGFSGAVRSAKWHILASFLFTLLGVVTSFFLTPGNEDWFYTFVSDDMAQGRTPASTRAELLEVPAIPATASAKRCMCSPPSCSPTTPPSACFVLPSASPSGCRWCCCCFITA